MMIFWGDQQHWVNQEESLWQYILIIHDGKKKQTWVGKGWSPFALK
jgi:hypothetical protein